MNAAKAEWRKLRKEKRMPQREVRSQNQTTEEDRHRQITVPISNG
jgi:hypothetical protein